MSHGSMRTEGMGFWRTTGVLLTCASLALLLWELPAHLADVRDLAHPPPAPPSLPAGTPDRARMASDLAASPAAPASLMALWRLAADQNDFVRGQALEALAQQGEGAHMDPRRADHMKEVAYDDTDWNRRSACVLLIQYDPMQALPLVLRLWKKTGNANTRAALAAALRARNTQGLRIALDRDAPDLLAELSRKL